MNFEIVGEARSGARAAFDLAIGSGRCHGAMDGDELDAFFPLLPNRG